MLFAHIPSSLGNLHTTKIIANFIVLAERLASFSGCRGSLGTGLLKGHAAVFLKLLYCINNSAYLSQSSSQHTLGSSKWLMAMSSEIFPWIPW